jgi:dimethylargininase
MTTTPNPPSTPLSQVTALVRPPVDALDDGVVDHIAKVHVDVPRARRQWAGYVEALRAVGWTTIEVPASPAHPDSVFVEDTAVVYGRHAVVARAGHPTRRGEQEDPTAVLAYLGLTLLTLPDDDATLDGGDVLKVGSTVYVGRSDRTNDAGVRGLRALLTPLGATVVAVPVTRVLHLKTAVTALPDGTVIGYEPFVDEPRLFGRFLPVPEPEGAAVVVLGPADVLLSASAPQTAALLTRLGYRVHPVEVDEFEKLEGCVTCLSIRVRA